MERFAKEFNNIQLASALAVENFTALTNGKQYEQSYNIPVLSLVLFP